MGLFYGRGRLTATNGGSRPGAVESYRLFGEALAATGRNITYSICPFIAGAAPAEGGAVIPTLALAVVGGHF
jgi:hypothetical protein